MDKDQQFEAIKDLLYASDEASVSLGILQLERAAKECEECKDSVQGWMNVLTHFSTLSMEDLRVAFELYAAGKLGVDLYITKGKFPTKSLGTILHSYQKWLESRLTSRRIDDIPSFGIGAGKKENTLRERNLETRQKFLEQYQEIKERYANTGEIEEKPSCVLWAYRAIEILAEEGVLSITQEQIPETAKARWNYIVEFIKEQ